MVLTDLSWLESGKQWPPPSQVERLQRYAHNRLLFESKHELVFTENFRRLLREEDRTSFEIVLNWPRRISTLWADLLFGEPPTFRVGEDDSDEQKALNSIINRNSLHLVGYEAVIDMSRYGEALLKMRFDQYGRIEAIPPTIWFPVVSEDNIKETTHHVLAWKVTTGEGVGKRQFLKVEIHEPGKATYRTYRLANGYIGPLVDEERTETFSPKKFLVRPVPNLLTSDSPYGFDDYEDISPIVSEIEVRVAQISRILDKHADPSMYGDEAALEFDEETQDWKVRGGSKFFPVSQGGVAPGYLAWNGQLEAAFKQLDTLMEQFYSISETSPAAFGQLKSGLAESGSALKRLMMAALAKVNRLRLRMDSALKEVLVLVSELEVYKNMSGAFALEDISITWEDGLPDDEREETEMANARVVAGTLSAETAVSRLDGLRGEALQKEMERIREERAAAIGPSPTATRFTFGEEEDPNLDDLGEE